MRIVSSFVKPPISKELQKRMASLALKIEMSPNGKSPYHCPPRISLLLRSKANGGFYGYGSIEKAQKMVEREMNKLK